MELRYKDKVLGGGSGGGSNAGEVYSSRETVIGTYFGKPLYSVSIYATTPLAPDSSQTQSYVTYGLANNTDEVVYIHCYVKTSTGLSYDLPRNFPQQTWMQAQYQPSNKQIAIIFYRPSTTITFGSENFGAPCVVTIKYTKTTDEPETT